MSVVEGTRRTDNMNQSDRVIDMSKTILEVEPDETPLTQFSKSLFKGRRSIPAKNVKFEWKEYPAEDHIDAVNDVSGYNSSATTIKVDRPELFVPGHIVLVLRTNEMLRVTDRDTNNKTIDVVRGYGLSTAASLADNDVLYVIGNASEEVSGPPLVQTRNEIDVYNYCQTFRTPVSQSDIQRSSDEMTQPHSWRFYQNVKAKEHRVQIEKAAIFGVPGEETGENGTKVRLTGGLNYFLTKNRMSVGGALTEPQFETFLRNVFRFGSKKKILFYSPLLASVLNSFSSAKLQTSVGDTQYGVKIATWHSTHGEVTLVKHNLLAPLGGHGFLIDPRGADGQVVPFAYRYLNGGVGPSLDTKLYEDIGAKEKTERMDEYRTTCGFQIGVPEWHGVITGVTG